jgi:hypothetical protein
MFLPVGKRFPRKISLRSVLIWPFVLQILGAVGLVGYLSYRSGRESVEKPADRLIVETGDRVEQQLENYLGSAKRVNLTNLAAYESGVLNLKDFNALGNYFYRQVKLHDFAHVNFGGVDGSFIGAGRGKFLKNLDRSDSRRIFIVERATGKLVATSTDESPAPVVEGKARRISGKESRDPIVREISKILPSLDNGLKLSRFKVEGENLFVRLVPYRNE